ncbi:MAG: hypoxanthine phosphoribosyltransferase [Clostridia bacterium]|nr:hypoxanthine phosphoribosyltransferase [Clostridia bacterium]
MLNDISSVLISKEEIEKIVSELADQINRDYVGKKLLLVGLLKGCIQFMSDLSRKITLPCEIDFMVASSYGSGTETSGVVKVSKDLSIDIEGYDVLIVEDVVDSGVTLDYIINMIKDRKPASLKLCTLLDKPIRRKKQVHVDYTGYVLPDEFVVGYGLDYAEKYRNLPFIGILKPEIYS